MAPTFSEGDLSAIHKLFSAIQAALQHAYNGSVPPCAAPSAVLAGSVSVPSPCPASPTPVRDASAGRRVWAELALVFWRTAARHRLHLVAHTTVDALSMLTAVHRALVDYIQAIFVETPKQHRMAVIAELGSAQVLFLLKTLCSRRACASMLGGGGGDEDGARGQELYERSCAYMLECNLLLWISQANASFCDEAAKRDAEGGWMPASYVLTMRDLLDCLFDCCAHSVACAMEVLCSEPVPCVAYLLHGMRLRISTGRLLRPSMIDDAALTQGEDDGGGDDCVTSTEGGSAGDPAKQEDSGATSRRAVDAEGRSGVPVNVSSTPFSPSRYFPVPTAAPGVLRSSRSGALVSANTCARASPEAAATVTAPTAQHVGGSSYSMNSPSLTCEMLAAYIISGRTNCFDEVLHRALDVVVEVVSVLGAGEHCWAAMTPLAQYLSLSTRAMQSPGPSASAANGPAPVMTHQVVMYEVVVDVLLTYRAILQKALPLTAAPLTSSFALALAASPAPEVKPETHATGPDAVAAWELLLQRREVLMQSILKVGIPECVSVTAYAAPGVLRCDRALFKAVQGLCLLDSSGRGGAESSPQQYGRTVSTSSGTDLNVTTPQRLPHAPSNPSFRGSMLLQSPGFLGDGSMAARGRSKGAQPLLGGHNDSLPQRQAMRKDSVHNHSVSGSSLAKSFFKGMLNVRRWGAKSGGGSQVISGSDNDSDGGDDPFSLSPHIGGAAATMTTEQQALRWTDVPSYVALVRELIHTIDTLCMDARLNVEVRTTAVLLLPNVVLPDTVSFELFEGRLMIRTLLALLTAQVRKHCDDDGPPCSSAVSLSMLSGVALARRSDTAVDELLPATEVAQDTLPPKVRLSGAEFYGYARKTLEAVGRAYTTLGMPPLTSEAVALTELPLYFLASPVPPSATDRLARADILTALGRNAWRVLALWTMAVVGAECDADLDQRNMDVLMTVFHRLILRSGHSHNISADEDITLGGTISPASLMFTPGRDPLTSGTGSPRPLRRQLHTPEHDYSAVASPFLAEAPLFSSIHGSLSINYGTGGCGVAEPSIPGAMAGSIGIISTSPAAAVGSGASGGATRGTSNRTGAVEGLSEVFTTLLQRGSVSVSPDNIATLFALLSSTNTTLARLGRACVLHSFSADHIYEAYARVIEGPDSSLSFQLLVLFASYLTSNELSVAALHERRVWLEAHGCVQAALRQLTHCCDHPSSSTSSVLFVKLVPQLFRFLSAYEPANGQSPCLAEGKFIETMSEGLQLLDGAEFFIVAVQAVLDAATCNYGMDHLVSSYATQVVGSFHLRAQSCSAEKPIFLDLLPTLAYMAQGRDATLYGSIIDAAHCILACTSNVRSERLLDFVLTNRLSHLLPYLEIPPHVIDELPFSTATPQELRAFWVPILTHAPARSELRFSATGGVSIDVGAWPEDGLSVSVYMEFHTIHHNITVFELCGEAGGTAETITLCSGDSLHLVARGQRSTMNESHALQNIQANRWVQFCLCIGPSGEANMFLNGTGVGTGLVSPPPAGSKATINLGPVDRAMSDALYAIGDIVLWDSLLTPAQVQAHFAGKDAYHGTAPPCVISEPEVPRVFRSERGEAPVLLPVDAHCVARYTPCASEGSMLSNLLAVPTSSSLAAPTVTAPPPASSTAAAKAPQAPPAVRPAPVMPIVAKLVGRYAPPPVCWVDFYQLWVSKDGVQHMLNWLAEVTTTAEMEEILQLLAETVRRTQVYATVDPRTYLLLSHLLRQHGALLSPAACDSLIYLATSHTIINDEQHCVVLNRHLFQHVLADVTLLASMPLESALHLMQRTTRAFTTAMCRHASRNALLVSPLRFIDRLLSSLVLSATSAPYELQEAVMLCIKEILIARAMDESLLHAVVSTVAQLTPAIAAVPSALNRRIRVLLPYVRHVRVPLPMWAVSSLTVSLLRVLVECALITGTFMGAFCRVVDLSWYVTCLSRFADPVSVIYATILFFSAAQQSPTLKEEVLTHHATVIEALRPHAAHEDLLLTLLAITFRATSQLNILSEGTSLHHQLERVLVSVAPDLDAVAAPVFMQILASHVQCSLAGPLRWPYRLQTVRRRQQQRRLSTVRRYVVLARVSSRLMMWINLRRYTTAMCRRVKELHRSNEAVLDAVRQVADATPTPTGTMPCLKTLSRDQMRVRSSRFKRVFAALRVCVLLWIPLQIRRYDWAFKGNSVVAPPLGSDVSGEQSPTTATLLCVHTLHTYARVPQLLHSFVSSPLHVAALHSLLVCTTTEAAVSGRLSASMISARAESPGLFRLPELLSTSEGVRALTAAPAHDTTATTAASTSLHLPSVDGVSRSAAGEATSTSPGVTVTTSPSSPSNVARARVRFADGSSDGDGDSEARVAMSERLGTISNSSFGSSPRLAGDGDAFRRVSEISESLLDGDSGSGHSSPLEGARRQYDEDDSEFDNNDGAVSVSPSDASTSTQTGTNLRDEKSEHPAGRVSDTTESTSLDGEGEEDTDEEGGVLMNEKGASDLTADSTVVFIEHLSRTLQDPADVLRSDTTAMLATFVATSLHVTPMPHWLGGTSYGSCGGLLFQMLLATPAAAAGSGVDSPNGSPTLDSRSGGGSHTAMMTQFFIDQVLRNIRKERDNVLPRSNSECAGPPNVGSVTAVTSVKSDSFTSMRSWLLVSHPGALEGGGRMDVFLFNVSRFTELVVEMLSTSVIDLALASDYFMVLLVYSVQWPERYVGVLSGQIMRSCIGVLNRPSLHNISLETVEIIHRLTTSVLRTDWCARGVLDSFVRVLYRLYVSLPPVWLSESEATQRDFYIVLMYRHVMRVYKGTKELRKTLAVRTLTQRFSLHDTFCTLLLEGDELAAFRAFSKYCQLHASLLETLMSGRPKTKADETLKASIKLRGEYIKHIKVYKGMIAAVGTMKEGYRVGQLCARFAAGFSSYTATLTLVEDSQLHWLVTASCDMGKGRGDFGGASRRRPLRQGEQQQQDESGEGGSGPLSERANTYHYFDSQRNYVAATIATVPHGGDDSTTPPVGRAGSSGGGGAHLRASMCEEQLNHIATVVPPMPLRCRPYMAGTAPTFVDSHIRLTPSALTLLHYLLGPYDEVLRFISNGFRIHGIHATPCLILLTDKSLRVIGFSRVTHSGDIILCQYSKDSLRGPDDWCQDEEELEVSRNGEASPAVIDSALGRRHANAFSFTAVTRRLQRLLSDENDERKRRQDVRDGTRVAQSVQQSTSAMYSQAMWRYTVSSIREVRCLRYMHMSTAISFTVDHDEGPMLSIVDAAQSMNPSARELFLTVLKDVLKTQRYTFWDDTQRPAALRTMLVRWAAGSVSNYDYLHFLNYAAGRVAGDYNQYPVFPWVLAEYQAATLDLEQTRSFRDLSLPIGAQMAERRRNLTEFYDNTREMVDHTTGRCFPFHHGTHYSTSGGVLYYLLRVEPFTTFAKIFQGGHFDIGTRLFDSVEAAFQSCVRGPADCKELVPEFYANNHFLTNADHLDLGERADGVPVNDVRLPPWAKGSVQVFTAVMRYALEYPHVTSHLHQWIDLIFGVRRRGPPAVESFNIFQRMTYSEEVARALEEAQTPHECDVIIAEVDNFGQTPQQLFQERHPSRRELEPVKRGPLTAGAVLPYVSLIPSSDLDSEVAAQGKAKDRHHHGSSTPHQGQHGSASSLSESSSGVTYTIAFQKESPKVMRMLVQAMDEVPETFYQLTEPTPQHLHELPVSLVERFSGAGAAVRGFTRVRKTGKLLAWRDRVLGVDDTDHVVCWHQSEPRLARYCALTGAFLSTLPFITPEDSFTRFETVAASPRESMVLVTVSGGAVYSLYPDPEDPGGSLISATLCHHVHPVLGAVVDPQLSRAVTYTRSAEDFPIVWHVRRSRSSLLHRLRLSALLPGEEGDKTVVSACFDHTSANTVVATRRHLLIFDSNGEPYGAGALPMPLREPPVNSDRTSNSPSKAGPGEGGAPATPCLEDDDGTVCFAVTSLGQTPFIANMTAVCPYETREWATGTQLFLAGHQDGSLSLWRALRLPPETVQPGRIAVVDFHAVISKAGSLGAVTALWQDRIDVPHFYVGYRGGAVREMAFDDTEREHAKGGGAVGGGSGKRKSGT